MNTFYIWNGNLKREIATLNLERVRKEKASRADAVDVDALKMIKLDVVKHYKKLMFSEYSQLEVNAVCFAIERLNNQGYLTQPPKGKDDE